VVAVGTRDVVVGVDGSAGAAPALRWATAEAARRGGRLRVVGAYRAPWPPAHPPAGVGRKTWALMRTEETVSGMVDDARAAAPGLVVIGLSVHGAPVPVLMAAAGPKALTLAAEIADIVTIAAGALASRDEFGAMVTSLRSAAGARADEIELAMNLFVVGDEVPPWTRDFIGADIGDLVAADSLTLLRGDVDAMVDELQRRRDAFGVSYVSVNGAFFEALAPVVERLAGQ